MYSITSSYGFSRRDARKAVYLQHGALDSSMGLVFHRLFETFCCLPNLMCFFFIFRWVSNGVVGSPAFAAYDQGTLCDTCLVVNNRMFNSVIFFACQAMMFT